MEYKEKWRKNSVYGVMASRSVQVDKNEIIKAIREYFYDSLTPSKEDALADISIIAVVTGDVRLLFRCLKGLQKDENVYYEFMFDYLAYIIELSIDLELELEDNSMQRKKVRSISVSDDAMSKLNRVASRAGRNRSEVIERLLVGISEDRLLWYARRKPDYDKKEVKDNEADADAESITT